MMKMPIKTHVFMGILFLTESEVQRTVDPSYFISGYPI